MAELIGIVSSKILVYILGESDAENFATNMLYLLSPYFACSVFAVMLVYIQVVSFLLKRNFKP